MADTLADICQVQAKIASWSTFTKGTFFGAPFNLDRLETQGTPVPLLEDVAGDPGTMGMVRFSRSFAVHLVRSRQVPQNQRGW